MISLFGNKDKKEPKKKSPAQDVSDTPTETKEQVIDFTGTISDNAYRVLKGVYVSEKASRLMEMNQYVFRVADDANKSEVSKQVALLFKVKVKDVKMVTIPDKRKFLGRYPGIKQGYKKAIVVLEKGQKIEGVRV